MMTETQKMCAFNTLTHYKSDFIKFEDCGLIIATGKWLKCQDLSQATLFNNDKQLIKPRIAYDVLVIEWHLTHSFVLDTVHLYNIVNIWQWIYQSNNSFVLIRAL